MNRPLRVLVVDDSETAAELFKAHLETDQSIKAEVTSSLAGAIQRVQKGGIDAVVLDLFLGDASDMEGVKAMSEAVPSVPIVVASGAFPPLERESLEAGAEDYLRKSEISQQLIVRALRFAVIRRQVRERFMVAHRSLDSTEAALRRTDQALKDADRFKAAVDTGKTPVAMPVQEEGVMP